MKKELLTLCLAFTLVLSACGNANASSAASIESIESTVSSETSSMESNVSSETSSMESAAIVNDAIKIDDIDIKVGPQIDDYGDRCVMLQYTNNSSYSILGVEIKYTQKDSVTDSDREILSDLKDRYEYTDDELKELYMTGRVECLTYPGETSTSQYVKLDDYIARTPSSMEQFDLMEPDIASIVFITPNNVLRMEYYDYKNGSYSLSNNTQENLYQIPKNGMEKYFIDIDTPFLQSTSDREDRYHGTAYHISKDDYLTYKEKWINAGYTNIDRESNDLYRATNDKNIEVTLEWYSQNNVVSIEIEDNSKEGD